MARGPRDTVLSRLRFMASREFLDAAGRATFEAADTMRAEAERSITAGSVSGKQHLPSKPGTPPNNDSGVLRANIEVSQPQRLVARVTSHAPYSAVHEFGSSTHPARPFMRPARDKVMPKARRIFSEKIREARRKFRPAK